MVSNRKGIVNSGLSKVKIVIHENKKSGTLSQNEMDSALVDLKVLISNFVIIE
jgi:hypothetical protein